MQDRLQQAPDGSPWATQSAALLQPFTHAGTPAVMPQMVPAAQSLSRRQAMHRAPSQMGVGMAQAGLQAPLTWPPPPPPQPVAEIKMAIDKAR